MPARADLRIEDVLSMLDSPYSLGKRGRTPSPAVIRGVLAASSDDPHHLLLRLAIDPELDDRRLAKAWDRAVQIVVDCNLTYGWGSKPRRDRIKKLARDKHALAAIQGTVANVADAPLDLLAVLVADASPASLDALVPHLAVGDRELRLDRLRKLRTHARRSAMLDHPLGRLLGDVDRAIEQRNAASPALALGPLIGVGAVEPLWFRATLGSTATAGTVPRIQANVTVDSRKARWFGVSVARITGVELEYTSFDARALHGDALGIGRCEAAELPAWLARAANRLRIAWDAEPYVASSLRGAKRAKVAAWLLG